MVGCSHIEPSSMWKQTFIITNIDKVLTKYFRSSQRRCSKKNVANFLEKHLCWSLFLIKFQVWKSETLWKRDSNKCSFLWNLLTFKNVYFEEYLRATDADTSKGVIEPWRYINKSNNSVFLRLKIYWNLQAFDLICTPGIWMKPEMLRDQASSSKF